MRRKKEDAEITRLRLLEAAGRVFSRKGFAATRLSDIAKDAKVTRGAIYWHFNNKRGLFDELIKEKIKPFFELTNEVIAGDRTPLEKLRVLMSRTASSFESNADFKTSQQLEFIITGITGQDKVIREYLNEEATKIKKALREVVLEGQAKGEIKDQIDAEDIIALLFIFLRGLSFILVKNEELFQIHDRIEQLVDLEIKAIQKT